MNLASLPVELLQSLGPFCDHRQLAALSRLNRHFHDIFNPLLYRHNAFKEDPSKSCVLWAAEHGSLSTVKLAFAHGANMKTLDAYLDEEDARLAKTDVDSYIGPLHIAVGNNFRDITLFLLDNGARLDVSAYCHCNCEGHLNDLRYYPLHFAICHGGKDVLPLLLERGAYYSLKDVSGLFCAIQSASHSAFDALLQQDSFDPHHQDPGGFTVLFYVAAYEDTTVAREMASKLADRGVPLDVLSGSGDTAVTVMIEAMNFKAGIELLEHGADPTITDWGDRGIGLFDTCLKSTYSDAIDQVEQEDKAREMIEDRRKLVSLLLANGLDPNRRLGHGAAPFSRPLFWALMGTRDVECVRLILDSGASIKSSFIENHESQSESILRVFFELFGKPDPDALKKWDPITISLEPYKSSLRLLLERGARIDSVDDEWSALSKTCELAVSDMGPEPLEFLVENATCRNVEAEHVELLRSGWGTKKTVYKLLDRLYDKLIKECECQEVSVETTKEGVEG
ncbi:hypothetical protein ACHAPT_011935 [Fusarium lateritium]